MLKQIKKVYRYFVIYGFLRTTIKILGRLRPNINLSLFFRFLPFRKGKGTVAIIGSGQHAYTSIAFFLSILTKAKILFVTDINPSASSSLAKTYGATDMGNDYTPGKKNINLPEKVYIASNHATHADYAIKYLEYKCDVFIEKPISINFGQLKKLSYKVQLSSNKIYSGYNRPFSSAIKTVRSKIRDKMPISLSCSVIGHLLPDNHWYRDVSEGTRVLSNMGHWIDLAIHLLVSRGDLPEFIDINYIRSDQTKHSDNVSIIITSSLNDLISIFFTSRSEPFEGVSEFILFQQDNLIAKINDFKTMELWQDQYYRKFNYRPKDNGHKNCIIEPFKKNSLRKWNEIEISAKLILHIDEMALNNINNKRIYL